MSFLAEAAAVILTKQETQNGEAEDVLCGEVIHQELRRGAEVRSCHANAEMC